MKTCDTCKFWTKPATVYEDAGRCHRFPPIYDRAMMDADRFPRTKGGAWCGEHIQKAEVMPSEMAQKIVDRAKPARQKRGVAKP